MRTEEEKITIRSYDQFASSWVEEHTDTTVFDNEFPYFQRYLPSGKVLEIGSGGGRDGVKLAKSYDYTGIDISQGLVDEARKRYPDLKFFNQSIYGIYLPAGEFDGFWCAATLIHVPKRRIPEALGNIRRVVKPKGVGMIALKRGDGDMVKEEEIIDGQTFTRYFSYYQEEEFFKVLDRAGFSCIQRSVIPVSQKTTWLDFIVQKN